MLSKILLGSAVVVAFAGIAHASVPGFSAIPMVDIAGTFSPGGPSHVRTCQECRDECEPKRAACMEEEKKKNPNEKYFVRCPNCEAECRMSCHK